MEELREGWVIEPGVMKSHSNPTVLPVVVAPAVNPVPCIHRLPTAVETTP